MLQVKTFEGLHERSERALEQAESKANNFLKTLMTEDIINVHVQTLVKPKEMNDGRIHYYTHHIITVVYRE
jgi:hypothetical protein